MGLGSENAIILLKDYQVLLPVVQTFPKEVLASDKARSLVREVSYEDINPPKKTNGSSVNPNFIHGILKCKENARTQRLLPCSSSCPSPHIRVVDWKNWISIFRKKPQSLEQLELYVEVLDDFMKDMWNISRNPVLHLQGKLEVGVDNNNLRWSPFYSATLDGCTIHLTEPKPKPTPLKTSVPVHMQNSWETWKLKLMLDVAVEWSDSFPLEIEIGSASEILKNLFENDATKDLKICVGNGVEVKCHSFILQSNSKTKYLRTHSSALTAMLSPANMMKEAQTRRIEMKDISEEAMIECLRYLYGMKLQLSGLNCDVALQLFQFADKYKLPKLEDACTQLLLAKLEDWFTPNVILELYYYAKNLETLSKLREHALRIMAIIPEKVRSCERFQELDPVEAADLAWKLIRFVQFK